ncbi:hypothetical protein GRI89_06535 [Altererythrobacter salegens]|uniref:DUF4139 domain-containing protein n=1 Tax=Croceibacterium salegens TaxID=1737568 RepID=A0A6I4ST87_9SPHN|nr:hypothetical protein [Croceibacterium salegens]MXO59194.1 hypothetical protein [Croceibacterium salegens]
MRRAALILAALPALAASPALARTTVDASAPQDVAVTLYRDPNRGTGQSMNRRNPRGFAMISETRMVTLPPGESTIRFEGVAEGMVAVTAIVTGLPGGTIEKNRNADLLSPAALVDGTLGNRVTVTRTNPATGKAVSEEAVIRTRADGGLVLQTGAGYEAVRCSGLPEKLTFDRVPTGLSAQPVFTIDTQEKSGGTYTVQLTYLAWGFDWQAHYVATLDEPGKSGDVGVRLMSWLTLLNDNAQSFTGAQLNVVAGRLEVRSNYQALSDPPDARPLRLTCYPIGHTWMGSPIAYPPPPPPPPPPAPMAVYDESDQAIIVTGSKLRRSEFAASSPVMVAVEENLGDLKLYRVPERVTVSAKGLKQVVFLDKDRVKGSLRYETTCDPWDYPEDEYSPASRVLATVNDKQHGLGVALPNGAITMFEPSEAGDLFVGEEQLRDYAAGQDVDIEVGDSSLVQVRCGIVGREQGSYEKGSQVSLRATLTNAADAPALVRLSLGASGAHKIVGLRDVRVKDGERIVELTVPANGTKTLRWTYRFDDE